MTQGFNSRYQQMLYDTMPHNADYYADKIARSFTGGKDYMPRTIIAPKLMPAAKVMKTVGKTTGKFAPGLGTAVSVGDAVRSGQLASELENINRAQPGRIPQEAIDYYRNKAKTIGTTTGLGLGIGAGIGALGYGVGALPGSLIGSSAGGALGDIGYSLWNWNNPYKEYKMTPEDRQILEDYLRNRQPNGMPAANATGVPTAGLQPQSSSGGGDFDLIDESQLGDLNAIQRAVSGGVVNVPGSNVTGMAAPTVQQLTQPVATTQTPAQQVQNAQIVNDYINRLQQIQQPYVDALQNYYNNYDKYLKDYHKKRDFYTGLAGWSGNNMWAEIGKDYNPLVDEANRLSALKQIQDAQAGNINAINEAMGNLAIAQEIGLPPEAAFANKNLLTMMSAKDRETNKYQIALENNLMKKYGIDRNNARAIAVQYMRGQTARDVANINAAAYGYSGGYPGAAPGLTPQGTAQPLINQTTKPQVVDPRQQFFQ